MFIPARARFVSLALLLVGLLASGPATFAGTPNVPIDADWSESKATPGPMDGLFDPRLQPESQSYIGIYLPNCPVEAGRLVDPAGFVVQSDDDANYSPDKSVHPASVSAKCRLTRLSNRLTLMVKMTSVYLSLPTPMVRGKTYRVAITPSATTAPATTTEALPALSPFRFDDRYQTSDNIKINQLGFLPDSPKRAYLGCYMGSGGGLPFGATPFMLIDDHGVPVFLGQTARRSVHEEIVGEQLYEMDFSAFTTLGRYRLFVPGVGISDLFEIGPDALTPGYVNLMRGFLHQRCGGPIDVALSRHHRDACHIDDAFIDPAAAKLKFVAPKHPPVYDTILEPGPHPAIHGHHDAGDYGKYTTNGASVVVTTLQAMEVFPDKFREDNLQMPNSGNGIPDVLEEVKWELDWLENMQDSDGGVFGVIKPNNGGYENMMPPKTNHRFFYPKDTCFTGAFAAALAHAACNPDIQKYYPQDAKRYLQKAILAWDWLAANQRYTEYFHYGALFGDTDERAWAAVELWAATGDRKYHEYFLKNFNPDEKRWGWDPLVEGIGHALERYVFLPEASTDQAMLARCKKTLSEACDRFVDCANDYPYRMSMPPESIKFGAYGWLFPGSQFGYHLLLGARLFNKPEYVQCALDNLNYTMGENPAGYFLNSTGMGFKRNIELVSQQSNFDDIIEPTPGLPSGVGSAGIYWLNQYGRTPGQGTYPPKDYPLMNRWYDGFNVNTEFTTDVLAKELIVAGYFAKVPDQIRSRPAIAIVADKVTGTAPLTIKFHAQTKVAAGHVRFVFWDFDDESFSTQLDPVHTFTGDGKLYHVGVTVIDDAGAFAYDEKYFTCIRKSVTGPTKPYLADERALVLFHFDHDLSSIGKVKPAIQFEIGRAGRDPSRVVPIPPHFMSAPVSGCLSMDMGDQLRATIPYDAIDRSKGFTIEAMMYVKAFAGWGWDLADPVLLGVFQTNDSMLGLRQEKWGHAGAPFAGAGNNKFLPGEKIKEVFPMDRWVHVALDFDGKKHCRLFIDDDLIGETDTAPLRSDRTESLVICVGAIKGMVSELRLSQGLRFPARMSGN